MADSNNINKLSFADLGISAPTSAQKKNSLGQEDFLKLMIAQLQNQDPLNPQSNGEFFGQMAQFGTVDGIKNLEQSFDSLSTSLQSNQALQASALVGRNVQVKSTTGVLAQNGKISGAIELPASASNVSMKIINGQGEIIKDIELGSQSQGMVNFTWDGIKNDGQAAAPGTYAIVAEGVAGGSGTAFTTYIDANVDSVTLGTGGEPMKLNVSGVGTVNLDEIKQIS